MGIRKRITKKKTTNQIKLSAKRQEKINRILAQSAQMFASKGYAQTTIRDISRAVCINQGVLYQYIKNKEDILINILFIFHDQWQAHLIKEGIYNIQDPDKQLRAAIRQSVEYLNMHSDESLIVYQESKSLPKYAMEYFMKKELNFVNFFARIIKNGIEQNVFDVEDPFYAANMILYQLNIFNIRKLYMQNKYSKKNVEGLTEEYVLKSVLNSTVFVEALSV